MSGVAADSSSSREAAGVLLRKLGVSDEASGPEARELLAELCALVSRRAARLAAMAIAAVCERMGGPSQPRVAGIDGSLFKLYPGFKGEMEAALGELGARCELVLAEDGSGVGAAAIGAAVP